MEENHNRISSRPNSRPSTPVSGSGGDDEHRHIRRPFHYYGSVGHTPEVEVTEPSLSDASEREKVMLSRVRYYTRLRRHVDSTDEILRLPDHVVPNSFFYALLPLPPPEIPSQSSLITIFAIWNTMMGTSLLSMPWALEHAGLALGPIIVFFMMLLCLYTAHLTIHLQKEAGIEGEILEVPGICGRIFGKWAEYTTALFFCLALLGACIVYWVLLSNFLYHTVDFLHDEVEGNATRSLHKGTGFNVICPSGNETSKNLTEFNIIPSDSHEAEGQFHRFWTLNLTAPLTLILILGPILNLKSPTFFTKFNAFGTLSIIYIMAFIIVKVTTFGFHVDVNDTSASDYMPLWKPHSAHILSGILALALFIHSGIITIMSRQEKPENNTRDLCAAYILVTLSYLAVGLFFYLGFPLPKICIEDNLLNNFVGDDVMSAVARVMLLFQMITVFPLLTYVCRSQVLYLFTSQAYPGFLPVLGVNVVIVTVCTLFAIFMPRIGTIIRYVGSFCALGLIFTFPVAGHLLAKHRKGHLTRPSLIIHLAIIAVGVINCGLQFQQES